MTTNIKFSDLEDELNCSICFGMLDNAVITPCGHSFCEECVTQWISENHTCPTCKHTIENTKTLVPNLALRRVSAIAMDAKKQTEEHHLGKMNEVMGKEDNPLAGVFSNNLYNVVERGTNLLEGIMAKSGETKRDLEAKFENEIQKVRHSHTKDEVDIEELVQRMRHDFENQISLIDETVAKQRDSLTRRLENHLHKADIIAYVHPIHMQVTIEHTPMRFDVLVQPTDMLSDVLGSIQHVTATLGNKLLSPDDCVVSVAITGGVHSPKSPAVANAASPIADDETVLALNRSDVVFDQIPKRVLTNGCILRVTGVIKMAKDEEEECLSLSFNKAEGGAFNFYQCDTCGVNWICESCSRQCHAGHEVGTHILDFEPSFGICYCPKKKLCKIPNKFSKKKKN
eukprot:TRINITY_DN777867_c0_g1_i1.p1 TRINITY_DN777867_c0_g1~~TRINITY_DN777867_c0_g1_i1.p1  ORF type:complete len:399 (+),score=81.19 TRINITY_DN777867_c0_g1_i1:157-1353(+)